MGRRKFLLAHVSPHLPACFFFVSFFRFIISLLIFSFFVFLLQGEREREERKVLSREYYKMFRPLLVLLGLTLLIVAAQAQCPNSVDGVSYPNLPQLTNSGPAATQKDWSLTGSDQAVYNWNICAVQNSCPSECGTTGTVACQSCASAPRSIGVISAQTFQVTPGINSVNFIYGQGSISSGCGGIARNSNISVACSTTATAAIMVNAPPNGQCFYTIIMNSSFACPSTVKPPPPLKPPSSGLSGGSIFLIVISCLFVTYMIAGALYQWKMHEASGMDLCPNREFWSESGSLIKGGTLFTWSKITGSQSSTSYESVE